MNWITQQWHETPQNQRPLFAFVGLVWLLVFVIMGPYWYKDFKTYRAHRARRKQKEQNGK